MNLNFLKSAWNRKAAWLRKFARPRLPTLPLFGLGVIVVAVAGPVASVQAADQFESQIQPLLAAYCVDCHSGDDPSGEVDFESMSTERDAEHEYEVWPRAVELLERGEMPPEDAEQPTESEREVLRSWYRSKFIENVTPRPGSFSPRRLSAGEYRNTLRSLLGFDLEIAIIEAEQTQVEKSLVMKLLPTDPPGESGFCNDTHSNPLTTNAWDQYSYLVDSALEELFSARRQPQLQRLIGQLAPGDVLHDVNGTLALSQQAAQQLIRNFLPLALRRTPSAEAVDQILHRIALAEDTLAATKVEMKTVLMSPTFLYRGLLMDGKTGQQQAVDSFELAERLSYFLWADMPDAELFSLAADGTLGQPGVLDRQVQRLLDSPKSRSLADDFARQWLALDDIDHVSNEVPYLAALQSQPREFIAYLFAEDRPLLELLDSDVTFANPLLRKFYGKDLTQLPKYQKPRGIEVEIVPLSKLQLQQTPGRGGLLTLPGILAMNRGPIIRGTWMLERILGEELPDPPANVGQVQPNRAGENLSFRQRFEQHRSNATCAICHDKIDPLGFALEAYASDGSYRLDANYKLSKKAALEDLTAPSEIDASGRLPTGEAFEDFEGLKHVLVTTGRQRVVRNLVRRLLAYALCRKLEYFDRPVVEQIVASVEADGTYRQLVQEIVHSLPFRETYLPGDAS